LASRPDVLTHRKIDDGVAAVELRWRGEPAPEIAANGSLIT
jgi:hypothetical protein